MQVQIAIGGQYMENYGAHDWDGKGQCPQYWKAKGEHVQIMVCNVDLLDAPAMVAEMEARMHELSWSDEGSSCYFCWAYILPNKLSSYDISAFQYKFFEEITSVSMDEINAFLKAFAQDAANDPEWEQLSAPPSQWELLEEHMLKLAA